MIGLFRQENLNERLYLLLVLFLLLFSTAISLPTKEDVLKLLNNPFHQRLFQNTYESLLDRLHPDGYLPESLTGAYGGEFPRTLGPYVFLLLENGELEKAKRVLKYVLSATSLAGMNRIPHVIGPSSRDYEPIPDKANPGQILHYIPLYRLDRPNYGGAQPFRAVSNKLWAVEVWLTKDGAEGELSLEVAHQLEGNPLVSVKLKSQEVKQGGWTRVVFPFPVSLKVGSEYFIRLGFEGKGTIIWWGLSDVLDNLFGGSYSYDKPPVGWQKHTDHITAFALDFGSLPHKSKDVIPIWDKADQPDGHYHFVLAWARYIVVSGDKGFENETYDQVAKLTDLACDMPYMNMGWGTTATYLVRNPCFEHSREVRFWDCYDLLTQVFTAEAWREMIPIARRRGDWEHYYRWKDALARLEKGIREFLTKQLDGNTIYAEMRLPDGGAGKLNEGLSWVNLSPIASGWKGVDEEILKATISAYRKRALFEWQGFKLLGAEWDPPDRIARAVIGKQWAWEFLYCVERGDWERACELLNFLEKANTSYLFAECFWVSEDGKMHLNDPGNGEQASWYLWAICRARKILEGKELPW
ncbi:hypothetical protein H5T87_08285 [bacterium]|nr:hypothetical protein [bacterium]